MRGDQELRSACGELASATQARDAGRADQAMTRLSAALVDSVGLSAEQTSVLAVVECLRARLDLDAGHPGAARLDAATAVAMVRRFDGDESSRTLVRVLMRTAELAGDVGDLHVARSRAREALAIAQAALGVADPDTADAWAVLGQACQAAGDHVGASAAGRQARLARQSEQTPNE